MKKIKEFVLLHRFWFTLGIGAMLFIASMKVGELCLLLFYSVDPTLKLFLATNLLLLFWWLFHAAYEMQDEAYYRRHFEKTGIDFEGRYTHERNNELRYEKIDD